MKPCEPKPTLKVRALDYLPDHPRFDGLRRLLAANELKRAEQIEMFAEGKRA